MLAATIRTPERGPGGMAPDSLPFVLQHLSDTELGERLAIRTLELIDIPSESRDEARLAEHLLRALQAGGVAARDAGDGCVLTDPHGAADGPLVLLGGHLDTVPAQGNRPGRRDADAVHGLGAADMLGAVAVAVELALAAAQPGATDGWDMRPQHVEAMIEGARKATADVLRCNGFSTATSWSRIASVKPVPTLPA